MFYDHNILHMLWDHCVSILLYEHIKGFQFCLKDLVF
jgi:hypothetical protein